MPTFNYKNCNINYIVSGKGSALVFLHGFLENLTMWNEVIPHLSKKRKVVCIDLLGHGETENLGYKHTMEEQAHLVRALLKSIDIRKATLIGHSMGGYIGLAFADLYPKNTKGVCLLNSTAFADTHEKKINRDRAIAAVKENHKTFIKVAVPALFSIKSHEIHKSEIKEVVKEALKTSQQGVIAALEGMKIRPDRSHILEIESLNKILILGKGDGVLPIKQHKKLADGNNTKFFELPLGHMSHIEASQDVINIFKAEL